MAKRRFQKWLAFCLAVSMLMGTTAMAADTTGQVAVETRSGKKEAVNVVIKVEKNGKTTKKTETAENFETESGMIVDYTGSSEMNDDGTGTAQSEYTVEKDDYSAEGGSEITAEKQAPGKITVDVPLTSEEGKNQNTVMGDKPGTIVDIDGKPKTSENDGTYNYTQTVIKEQGSVSVETEKITVTETINGNGSKMEQVVSETTPDADNDLMRQAGSPLSKDLPDAAPTDGYEYVFIGTGNSSQFWASYLYKTPGYEGEQPVYTDADGNSYYDHNRNDPASGHKYYVEGLYVNGEQVVEETDEQGAPNEFYTSRSGVFQFVMYDPATGKVSTTYCADLATDALEGYSYNIENLEQADYYTDAEAAMIRTVAKNGYWGVDATIYETDRNGNKVPKMNKDGTVAVDPNKTGSLEAVKKMMTEAKDENGNRVFTDEEVAKLTDGMAQTATQYAIWTFSNKMNNIEFVNTYYSHKDENNHLIEKSGTGFWADVPEEERENDSVDLIFKLYEHLVNLDPTPVQEATTSNTIINAENFVQDLSVNVVEKIKGHENNQDDDDTNDAYTTDITFALVVTPSTENGDDLIVRVYGSDMTTPLAEGRIAGEASKGENVLTADANGNYTFKGITVVEGDQNFNITLEGVQNLEQGVYLYSSEVKGGAPSQTMVGIAEGERKVDVEMNISFELGVEDEIVAREHYWRSERDDDDGDDDDIIPPTGDDDDDTPKGDDDDDDTTIGDDDVPKDEFPGDDDDTDEIPEEDTPKAEMPDEDIPLEEMPDEDVPLADVPKTGDVSVLWFALSALSGAGLVGLNLTGKKREDEE